MEVRDRTENAARLYVPPDADDMTAVQSQKALPGQTVSQWKNYPESAAKDSGTRRIGIFYARAVELLVAHRLDMEIGEQRIEGLVGMAEINSVFIFAQ
jgi:hypothetical protein